MTRIEQMMRMERVCAGLGAQIEYGSGQPLRFTAVFPLEGYIVDERKAAEVQRRIESVSRQYPDIVCYCFDADSTLIYVV